MAFGVRTRMLSLLTLMLVSEATSQMCVFPTEWSGTWFDLQYSSRHRVTFIRDTLTNKGRCIQSRPESGHYMLLRDAGEDAGPSCYLCIIFTRRTSSVLQYKEAAEEQMACPSSSDSAVQFEDVCNNFLVNNKLYTLLREAAVPMACPFHGSYLFTFDYTYSGGCGGVYRQPQPASLPTDQQSRVMSCASDTQQLWSFVRRPCHPSHLPAVDNKNVQCISNWRDGDDWIIIKYDTEYRCVKLSMDSGGPTMILSEDGTCDAMFDFKSPLMMRLVSVPIATTASSATRCILPKWTTDAVWTDLSRRMHITGLASRDGLRQVVMLPGASRGQSQLSDSAQPAAGAQRNETLARYTCLSTQASESFYMRAVEGCRSGCRCISMLWSPSGDVAVSQAVTMIRGPLEECSANAACPAAVRHAERSGADIWQLFDSSKKESSCPFTGVFKAQSQGEVNSKHEVVYRFNCSRDQPASVVIETRTCSTDSNQRSECRSVERSLSCLAAWGDGGRGVVVIGKRAVVTAAGARIVTGACYSIQIDSASGSVRLISNASCNTLLSRSMEFNATLPLEIMLQPLRESCREEEISRNEVSSVKYNTLSAAPQTSRFSVSVILPFIAVGAQQNHRWLRPTLDPL